MLVAKWEQFENADALRDRVNRMFNEVFPRAGEDKDPSPCAWKPAVDILETETGIVITADLPGVRKSDVLVETRDNVVTLTGERRFDGPFEEERYHRKERCAGTFHRAFTLGFAPPPDDITATLKNGVLTIRLPFPKTDPLHHVSVNVR